MTTCPACGLATDNLMGHCADVHKTPLEELSKPQPVQAQAIQSVADGLTEEQRPSGLSIVREKRGPYL